MARPRKDNCDYFPHVVGMLGDPKMRFAVNDCGAMAYAVYCAVLEAVFSYAFFIPREAEAFRILPVDLRIAEREFDETMEVLIGRKLVDGDLYQEGTVTSAGMAKQYFNIKNRTEIPDEWELLLEKLGLSPEKLGLGDEKTPQRKEKKNKENKRKENGKTGFSGTTGDPLPPCVPPPRCPGCEGPLRFDAAEGMWSCIGCGSTFKTSELMGGSR